MRERVARRAGSSFGGGPEHERQNRKTCRQEGYGHPAHVPFRPVHEEVDARDDEDEPRDDEDVSVALRPPDDVSELHGLVFIGGARIKRLVAPCHPWEGSPGGGAGGGW